jgi:DNA mismatch repair protein MSH5
VPNDTLLVGGSDSETNDAASSMDRNPSMLLLTGPNYSGKSVYMKQVSWALSLWTSFSNLESGRSDCLSSTDWEACFPRQGDHAQANNHSFVPADSAELGVTDKILTKINTQESVSKVSQIVCINLGFGSLISL